MADADISGYTYRGQEPSCAHTYLLPTIAKILGSIDVSSKRAFDLGCGNGSFSNWLTLQGYEVTGVDPSATGIAIANRAFPDLNLKIGSGYDRLYEKYGKFPLVISLEVIEHVYAPREFAKCIHDLLAPNGYALISTPYHGYLKNLALAITGKMDDHYTALWDHGHIKFWSQKTIAALLTEVGLKVTCIHRLGRIPQLAKTMVVIARRF